MKKQSEKYFWFYAVNLPVFQNSIIKINPDSVSIKLLHAENNQRQIVNLGVKPIPYTKPQLIPIINIIPALCFILAVVLPRKWGQAVIMIMIRSDKQNINTRAGFKGAGDFSVEEF
jgi:hypothetical protein